MPLRKSPTTPARLEANRRKARKSPAPRTPRSKSQSRLNGLRSGARSRLYGNLLLALSSAPLGAAIQTARATLAPAQARHPLFARLVGLFRKSQGEVPLPYRRLFPAKYSRKNDSYFLRPKPVSL
jgi:hypothetical protein